MSSKRPGHCTIFFTIFLSALRLVSYAQTESYTQFWNEIDLVRAISDKWAAEIDLSGTFSNTPSESRVLKNNIQRNITGWGHYYLSARWKFSAFMAYYLNKDVPEIGQYKSNEWRFGIQGSYYFHKVRYSLNTDMRFELRLVQNEDGEFQDIYRYRQKLKFKLPLNSQVLRKGVVYLLASEEIVLRSISKSEGFNYFDCNLFTVGAGYLFTDDLQLEAVYVNAFIPRDDGNEIDNALSVTFTVNNLISKIGKMFTGSPAQNVQDE
jgi:hypothetical protein